MKKCFSILALLCCMAAFSQRTIKGRVVTEDDVPVPGSSVFISNTSTGTTSDKQGNFELQEVPAGKNDLIISSIGYETNVYSFSSDQLPLKLKVVMRVKVKELENVMVEPSVIEGWDKWGKLFTDNFIGNTPNGTLCKIKNYRSIRFRYFKKSNRVIAYCDEPIILENKALGYLLRYQMESFEVNFKEHSSAFSGYPFFEEIDKKRQGLRNKWKDRRDKAYYGSMMHFMRAVYTDSIVQQGFEVRRMMKIANTEKERVKKIYAAIPLNLLNTAAASNFVNGPGIRIMKRATTPATKTVTDTASRIDTAAYSPDSIRYYQRILKEDDLLEIYGQDILPADSVIAEKNEQYKLLLFPNYLYVTYKKEFEDPEYLRFHGENRSISFQRSYIWLTNKDGVVIDQNGSYFPPQAIYSMAYWGWNEKMAEMLPIDYVPGDE